MSEPFEVVDPKCETQDPRPESDTPLDTSMPMKIDQQRQRRQQPSPPSVGIFIQRQAMIQHPMLLIKTTRVIVRYQQYSCVQIMSNLSAGTVGLKACWRKFREARILCVTLASQQSTRRSMYDIRQLKHSRCNYSKM
jgi:hypothetical protein